MEYNTSRNHLVIPEYGRNVQKMVEHAITIEDREERNKVANAIVKTMLHTSANAKDTSDYLHKAWNHLFVIADFKLDVDTPFEKPTKDNSKLNPDRLDYSTKNIKYKHYGKNIESLIAKALEMEEGEQRTSLVMTIANHMKKSYIIWNRGFVSDSIIFEHLSIMSDGQLNLNESEHKLNQTNDIMKVTQSTSRDKDRRRPGAGGRSGGKQYSRHNNNPRNNNNRGGSGPKKWKKK